MKNFIMTEEDRKVFITSMQNIKNICEKSGFRCFDNCPMAKECDQNANSSSKVNTPSEWILNEISKGD